jgi:hypothetical protein
LPPRPMRVRPLVPAAVVAGWAAVTGAPGELNNWYAISSSATPPNPAAHITFFRLSDPICT